MSRLLLLTLLYFAVPETGRVSGKVFHIRRQSPEYTSPTLVSLPGYVPLETDDVTGGDGFSDGSHRRVKRSTDSEKLLVNMTILPDEGHNEAIVHWSGERSQVRFFQKFYQLSCYPNI